MSTDASARPSGVRMMMWSAFLYSVMSAFVKLLGDRIPSSEIALVRGAITCVVSYIAVRRLGLSPFGVSTRWLIVRGLLGVVGMNCYFYALTALPLAEATVLHFLSPIFVAILAPLVLRERMRPIEAIGSICGFVGIVIVAQPAFLFGRTATTLPIGPVLVAVLGAMAGAGAHLVIRKLKDTEDPMVVVFHSTMLIAPLSLPLAMPQWVWPSGFEWLVLGGIAACAQLGQMQMTRGIHLETAARATTISYLQIPLTILWSTLFFGLEAKLSMFAGAALVFAGTLAISVPRDRPSQLRDTAS